MIKIINIGVLEKIMGGFVGPCSCPYFINGTKIPVPVGGLFISSCKKLCCTGGELAYYEFNGEVRECATDKEVFFPVGPGSDDECIRKQKSLGESLGDLMRSSFNLKAYLGFLGK